MDLVELKRTQDTMGAEWKLYRETLEADRAKGEVRGETKEKLAKIDASLTKLDEFKAAAERFMVSAQTIADAATEAKTPDPKLAEYKTNLAHYVRTGEAKGLNHREVKTLSSLSNPDGGYYVTFDRDPEFMRSVVETSPMRSVARVETIAGASRKGRKRTARMSTGGWVGEIDSRAATGTPQVGEWEIFAKELYAYPEAPQTFLEDSEVNAEAWLMEELGLEIPLLENTAFMSGDGHKRPRGVLTYATTDPGTGEFIEVVPITTSNVIVGDDFINLQGSLLEDYQAGASWLIKRATLTEARKIKVAADGHYLWQPGLTVGVPSTILDKPYTLMDGMAEVEASATTIPLAYGDFKKGYRILDRRGITVIRDNLTNKPFVGFYVTKRVGGGVVRFDAIKLLQNKT